MIAFPSSAGAQTPESDTPPVPPLFATHDPLEITIAADLTALRGDRSESPDRPGVLTVAGPDGLPVEVGADIRTRGEFRLDPGNCAFPPLRIDVDRSDAVGTVLEGQDELKFVSSCRPGRDAFEDLVRAEWVAYRLYQELTPESFRVRLLDVTFVDTGAGSVGEEPERRIAFVIEEDEMLAERRGAQLFELDEGRNLPPEAFDPMSAMTNAVFQYMIGGTDWSGIAGHNVEILERTGVATVVPYDFDFSGLVDAPYAEPAPDLGLSDVRERRYRGWCANSFATATVLERFRAAQSAMLAIVSEAPDLGDEPRRRIAGYLASFFEDIETDQRAERRFLRDCRQPERGAGDRDAGATERVRVLSTTVSDGSRTDG